MFRPEFFVFYFFACRLKSRFIFDPHFLFLIYPFRTAFLRPVIFRPYFFRLCINETQ